MNQGFTLGKLKSSLRKFQSRHHDLVSQYGISVSQITTNILRHVRSPFMTYHWGFLTRVTRNEQLVEQTIDYFSGTS